MHQTHCCPNEDSTRGKNPSYHRGRPALHSKSRERAAHARTEEDEDEDRGAEGVGGVATGCATLPRGNSRNLGRFPIARPPSIGERERGEGQTTIDDKVSLSATKEGREARP